MPMDSLEVCIKTRLGTATAEAKRVFIRDEKDPDPNAKSKSIPIWIRRIVIANAFEPIKFCATRRGGIMTFSDSRSNSDQIKKSYNVREMRAELVRMLGENDADRLLNVVLFAA